MKKVFYLSTCDSNKRILKELNLSSKFIKQDIKTEPISKKELERLYEFTNSYEELVNKRSRLYIKRKLKSEKIKRSRF